LAEAREDDGLKHRYGRTMLRKWQAVFRKNLVIKSHKIANEAAQETFVILNNFSYKLPSGNPFFIYFFTFLTFTSVQDSSHIPQVYVGVELCCTCGRQIIIFR
jgi:hypothetical protein